jgi:hypothetical protein
MFSFISKNWQGIPLVGISVIVNLIGSTKTEKGLSIRCVLDEATYEKGIKVADEDFDLIRKKMIIFMVNGIILYVKMHINLSI